MENIRQTKLQYPIGKYQAPEVISSDDIKKWIQTIEFFPEKLEALVGDFDDKQLDTQYRPGGWTVKQLIHHIADSHINGYIRFKWTLTEDKPVIKKYFEDRWANLEDSRCDDIEMSLLLIESLHKRWVSVLKKLSSEQLKRSFIHPETSKEIALDKLISIYHWHCRHHFAHLNNLAIREEWL